MSAGFIGFVNIIYLLDCTAVQKHSSVFDFSVYGFSAAAIMCVHHIHRRDVHDGIVSYFNFYYFRT